jgi:integrase
MSELTHASPIARRAADLARKAADLGRAATAPKTRTAYTGDWSRFQRWCRELQLAAMPAAPETIGLYIAALLEAGKAPSTIDRAISAIAHQHRMNGTPLNRKHPAIAAVLSGAKRILKRPVKQVRPLVASDIRLLLEVCGQNRVGKRNRALLLTGFAGALRGSELVGLTLEQLVESKDGYQLTLSSSKGDQEGRGQVTGLPRDDLNPNLCPVRALKAWIAAADIDAGPIFYQVNARDQVESFGAALTDRSLRRILKELARRAGFKPAEIAQISGHSLRAGHITTGYLHDVAEPDLQAQARHQDPKTTRRYYRPATVFSKNSARGLLAK